MVICCINLSNLLRKKVFTNKKNVSNLLSKEFSTAVLHQVDSIIHCLKHSFYVNNSVVRVRETQRFEIPAKAN